jgi:hypothetical protein
MKLNISSHKKTFSFLKGHRSCVLCVNDDAPAWLKEFQGKFMHRSNWPAFIRDDCDWGSDTIMTEAEQRGIDYLFKLRKSPCQETDPSAALPTRVGENPCRLGGTIH